MAEFAASGGAAADQPQQQVQSQPRIHLVPCKIDFHGRAPVSQYFVCQENRRKRKRNGNGNGNGRSQSKVAGATATDGEEGKNKGEAQEKEAEEREEEETELRAQLRGRELVGSRVQLSAPVLGFVAEKVDAQLASGRKRRLRLKSQFQSLVHWEHGVNPWSTKLQEYLDLLDVCRAIHS